jgi:hypothetical protein
MKRMRTAADSDSATSESDVENSYNTADNEVETDSASESDSDNVDDTSSDVGGVVVNTKAIHGLLSKLK